MTQRSNPLPPPEARSKLPDCAGLRILRMSGWTHDDIADEYGVTPYSVYRKLKACRLVEERTDYSSLIPWKVCPEHRTLNTNVMLTAAARLKLGTGRKIPPRKRREVENWLADLEAAGLVVAYGTHIDSEGERSFGFYFTPRRPGVDNWIIREPAEPAA